VSGAEIKYLVWSAEYYSRLEFKGLHKSGHNSPSTIADIWWFDHPIVFLSIIFDIKELKLFCYLTSSSVLVFSSVSWMSVLHVTIKLWRGLFHFWKSVAKKNIVFTCSVICFWNKLSFLCAHIWNICATFCNNKGIENITGEKVRTVK
jgi:hypothetical protein